MCCTIFPTVAEISLLQWGYAISFRFFFVGRTKINVGKPAISSVCYDARTWMEDNDSGDHHLKSLILYHSYSGINRDKLSIDYVWTWLIPPPKQMGVTIVQMLNAIPLITTITKLILQLPKQDFFYQNVMESQRCHFGHFSFLNLPSDRAESVHCRGILAYRHV